MLKDDPYLAQFPTLAELASSAPAGWSDSDVPSAQRGVRVSWLVGWVRSLLQDINRQPTADAPMIPSYALLNVRALVEHFVLPLTSTLRAPLWAYVPAEQRGKPDFFLS